MNLFTKQKYTHTHTHTSHTLAHILHQCHLDFSVLFMCSSAEADPVSSAPSLDPLLAGLVAAFIITAIIITLLVFIRMRRRDNRPEFHRLQDLPMVSLVLM